MEEKIVMAVQNIRTALDDYNRHIDDCDQIAWSEPFVKRLASDSTKAKQDLRELFRKSPSWDEELDAIVLNGNRTHEPVAKKVLDGIFNLLVKSNRYKDTMRDYEPLKIAEFFAYHNNEYLPIVQEVAPNAWKPGKKLSRVLHGVCKALGIVDETKGSWFQRKFAEVADEMNSKKLSYKLFLSLNPAHFLTMSNPHGDDRGQMLTSCHSLTCTEYQYNNGCTGYARDPVTFIAFTVADPSDKETLNNRKTTRQLFMYEPGNGVLCQSRLYTTNGGADTEVEEYRLYRDLVQREIALLEGEVNLWTKKTVSQWDKTWVHEHGFFGGYADWWHFSNLATVSVLKSHMETASSFIAGEAGLCLNCGEEIDKYLYCNDCLESMGYDICFCCGNAVHHGNGNEVHDLETSESLVVCDACYDSETVNCYCCERDVLSSQIQYLSGIGRVCDDCAENYEKCDWCNNYGDKEEAHDAIDHDGSSITVCEYCYNSRFSECKECDDAYPLSTLRDGLCPECFPRVSRETLGRHKYAE
jgi:hypothetical protein